MLSTWHIVHINNNKTGAPTEELVINFQGVLCKHDLPPFVNQIPYVDLTLIRCTKCSRSYHRNIAKQVKYIRQSTSITGLGAVSFDACIKGMTDIYALFSRYIPVDKLQPCTSIDKYGEYPCIEMSNRYFMLKKDTLMEKSMPFGSDIDPKGILNCAAGNSYIHSEQNRVLFYE
jgi:hypothetical protein